MYLPPSQDCMTGYAAYATAMVVFSPRETEHAFSFYLAFALASASLIILFANFMNEGPPFTGGGCLFIMSLVIFVIISTFEMVPDLENGLSQALFPWVSVATFP